MVSLLIQGLNQGLQDGSLPVLVSPCCSPTTLGRGILPSPTTPPIAVNKKKIFFQFSCKDQVVGRVVIMILDNTGRLGVEFESLATGRFGFGYKGSRMFASCPNEWCLMGDLLYDMPIQKDVRTKGWFSTPKKGEKCEKDEEEEEEEDEEQVEELSDKAAPTLYKGYMGFSETQETPHPDVSGSVVMVGSDFSMFTSEWILGSQFKICLSDSLIRSGRVFGKVVEGMEVAVKLSQMTDKMGNEPPSRITISDCGAC